MFSSIAKTIFNRTNIALKNPVNFELQQWRSIRVKVRNNNLDQALFIMQKKMQSSGMERLIKREQLAHIKNSEKRVLARKILHRKIRSQELARKLKSILIKKVSCKCPVFNCAPLALVDLQSSIKQYIALNDPMNFELQQWRGIRVKVRNNNLDQALFIMQKKMQSSGMERLIKREQLAHIKNSEKRVLARKILHRKIRSQELARKLKSILIKKVRGL